MFRSAFWVWLYLCNINYFLFTKEFQLIIKSILDKISCQIVDLMTLILRIFNFVITVT